MLAPKKVKWRKMQKGRRGGMAWRGSALAFGDFGLQTLDRLQRVEQVPQHVRLQRVRCRWQLRDERPQLDEIRLARIAIEREIDGRRRPHPAATERASRPRHTSPSRCAFC